MAERTVLCIEPDAGTVALIRSAFSPYGIAVESIPNGDQAIEWARIHIPALIVLSVEPGKSGYAYCNKLKRSPSLREVPLILISAYETQATFEQHKKLKSRAEEYLLKPFAAAEMIEKAEPFLQLGAAVEADEIHEIADDDIAEISGDEEDDEPSLAELASRSIAAGVTNGSSGNNGSLYGSAGVGAAAAAVTAQHSADPGTVERTDESSDSLAMLGDLSRPAAALDPDAPSPFLDAPVEDHAAAPPAAGTALPPPGAHPDAGFDTEQFDKETQAAFAALEAGAAEGGTPAPALARGEAGAGDTVDLGSLWSEEDLPEKMAWEPAENRTEVGGDLGMTSELFTSTAAAPSAHFEEENTANTEPPPGLPLPEEAHAHDAGAPAFGLSIVPDVGVPVGASAVHVTEDPAAAMLTPPPMALPHEAGAEEVLLAGLGTEEVPPMPEEVLWGGERAAAAAADSAAKDARIEELAARAQSLEEALAEERRAARGRTSELEGRIGSLESERQMLRKELDEQHARASQVASQGALSKERDILGLREIINRKEKDILDLRDGLDAKERQILDHKDKIRELERSRRDLDERTLGFERSLVAANEKLVELAQDREKSVEREKGLKARLDDAHEELRKAQDAYEELRRRLAQTEERGRAELEKARAEADAKLAETIETHRAEAQRLGEERAAAEAARETLHATETARAEAAHKVEIEGLQRRLADEAAAAAERLQSETGKLRRDHEKAIASLSEERALQLASERQAYEAQTEAKQRAHREEILGLRRRHEEELAAAEERRQRDVAAEEQRRIGELEQAEGRRRAELQARDEEHHARVTESDRRHLIEKTELAERHRAEHDQAVGRAARAEGELAARAQELEQAYRRLAGFEADLDAARAELGDRDVKLAQARDRVAELEAKVADYEDQVVRAFQRLRADEKTTEKIRRALGVALALLDERSVAAAAALKPGVADEAEKS